MSPIDALRNLHRVCHGMDLERQDDRPTEAEYQAAMADAEAALREHDRHADDIAQRFGQGGFTIFECMAVLLIVGVAAWWVAR